MNDTINRQDAINTALEFFVEFLGGAFHEDDQKILVKRMNELPSAERKGQWILKKELVPLPWDCEPLDWDNYDEATHSEWTEAYHCSVCDWKSGAFEGGNYCLNCGADMRDKKETEPENMLPPGEELKGEK